ncbi:MAG: TRAP transporter large permease subunit [Neptuniibacter sp.]
MFILLSMMLDRSEMSDDLMSYLPKVFGQAWAGLAVSLTVVGLLLATSTGISGASMTLLAGLGVALMLLNGYNKNTAFSKKRLTINVFNEVGRGTTRTTAFIFALLLGATAFSLVLRGLGGDEMIEDFLNGLPFGPTGIYITILIVTFILGFFLDWIELTLIILPLVAAVVANLGFDLVWFTILFAVCLQTSFLTPPVGFALFYLKGVAPEGINLGHIYRGVIPFILIQLIGLAVVFYWENIVLWLPAMAYSQ